MHLNITIGILVHHQDFTHTRHPSCRGLPVHSMSTFLQYRGTCWSRRLHQQIQERRRVHLARGQATHVSSRRLRQCRQWRRAVHPARDHQDATSSPSRSRKEELVRSTESARRTGLIRIRRSTAAQEARKKTAQENRGRGRML